MWILPSHAIIISSSSTGSSSACGACGVGSVFSPNEEIFFFVFKETLLLLCLKNTRKKRVVLLSKNVSGVASFKKNSSFLSRCAIKNN